MLIRSSPPNRKAKLGIRSTCLGTIIFIFIAAAAHGDTFTIRIPDKLDTPSLQRSHKALQTFFEAYTGEKFRIDVGNELSLLREPLTNTGIIISAAHSLGALAKDKNVIPLAMFDDIAAFVVVVSGIDESIYQLSDLSGKSICSEQIPALFTLHLLFSIDNPNREPIILPLPTDERKLRQLAMGNCSAAVINIETYLKASAANESLRIIFQSRTMPTYGIGINSSLPSPLKNRLEQIIFSKEANSLLQSFIVPLTGAPGQIIKPDLKRLKSLSAVLENWGY